MNVGYKENSNQDIFVSAHMKAGLNRYSKTLWAERNTFLAQRIAE